MFNSATNSNTPPAKSSFLDQVKKAAKTAKSATQTALTATASAAKSASATAKTAYAASASAAKSASASAKVAAESARVASGSLSSMVKQATSSVSETKYLKSQTKVDSGFDHRSPDSENYKFDAKESDVKQGKGVDPKLFSCLVHISCENAKLLKEKLQKHICAANQEHNQLEIHLKELQQSLDKINNLENGKYSLDFKNLTNEYTRVSQKIDELRFAQRTREIVLEGDQQITVFITIKGYTDINEAKIVKITPRDGKFSISYTDAKGKPQVLSGIEFSKLCIGTGEGIHVKDPAKGCDLPNVDCPLQGGKRKTSRKASKKGSKKSKKSKKSRKMVGGGDVDSISTNSLC